MKRNIAATICVLFLAIGLELSSCARKNHTTERMEYNGYSIEGIFIRPDNPNRLNPIMLEYNTSGNASLEDSLEIIVVWLVNGEALGRQKDNQLAPAYFNRGDRVRAEVSLKSKGRVVSTAQSNQVEIGNSPPSIMQAYVANLDSSKPWLGFKLFVYSDDKDNDPVALKYSWRVDSMEVADTPTLPGGLAPQGKTITAVVTPNDGFVNGEPYLSVINQEDINQPPRITSTPPSDYSQGRFVYQVQAVDPENDSLTYALKEGPEGMTVSAGGLLNWEMPGSLDGGNIKVAIEVTDGYGGYATQQFNLNIKSAEK